MNNLKAIEIFIELLTSEKTHGGVKKIILEAIDRLLTFDGTYNDGMDIDVPALDIPIPSLPLEYESNNYMRMIMMLIFFINSVHLF